MIDETRLVRTFLELVAIDSPSGEEQAIGEELMRRLAGLGGQVYRDQHGNVLAAWPEGQGEWLLLSAHMDTVGKDKGIRPQIREGIIYSDGSTILGADDKSGVAAILEVLTSLREENRPHPPLEVVISVGEELGLRGAKLLDKGRLHSRRGYVLDAGGPIGTIVVQAPSQDVLNVTIQGKRAHAGSEPEHGINAILVASEAIAAMPLGRIDAETTANIGVIQGGVATNIVPDEVRVRGEARSRDPLKLERQVAAMTGAFQDAAARRKARAQVEVTRSYGGYRLSEDDPLVAAAAGAAQKLGFTVAYRASGGGADANIYTQSGIHCVVLSTGMAEVHTPAEHIAVADMVDATRLLAEIVALG